MNTTPETMDLTQWEKLNPRRGNDETNQAWERELEDDECMRDAPPPPPRSRTNSLSTHSSDGDAPPREAVELCGICMLIEHMMANPPPGAAEPQQLSAFWATTDAMAGAVPLPNVAELHDFLFRLFATTGHPVWKSNIHRADAVTGPTSRRWRGASEI